MENTTKTVNQKMENSSKSETSENTKTVNQYSKSKVKNAVIVGASSGIGLATAKLLAKEGYHVFNIARSAPDLEIDTIIADAGKEGELGAAIALAAADFPIDVLVYSAGCSMASPIEYADPSDYRYLFEVNLFGALESIKAAVPLMKKSGGRIVLIGSMGGTFPIAFDAFYSASKAAIDMIAAAGDMELKPKGIRVCSVAPGGVATKFTFKRNIYGSSAVGEYAEKQERAVASLAEMEQSGISASEVANAVLAVINMANPPVKLAVGLKNKLYCAAARLLPDRIVSLLNAAKYEQ